MIERETGVTLKQQGAEVLKVDTFKHLYSTIQSNEQCTEVKVFIMNDQDGQDLKFIYQGDNSSSLVWRQS